MPNPALFRVPVAPTNTAVVPEDVALVAPAVPTPPNSLGAKLILSDVLAVCELVAVELMVNEVLEV